MRFILLYLYFWKGFYWFGLGSLIPVLGQECWVLPSRSMVLVTKKWVLGGFFLCGLGWWVGGGFDQTFSCTYFPFWWVSSLVYECFPLCLLPFLCVSTSLLLLKKVRVTENVSSRLSVSHRLYTSFLLFLHYPKFQFIFLQYFNFVLFLFLTKYVNIVRKKINCKSKK